MVIRKLNLVAEQIDGLDFSSTSRASTQIFGGFNETYFYINYVISHPFMILCFIGMSIQGLLNALVFSQDIAVTRTFQAIKQQ
ncbi:6134_t:CDS:2, partial [Cetraspora pellucida]